MNNYTPWNKGKKLSAEHIAKLKLAKLGKTPWNKGVSGYHTTKLGKTGWKAWNKGIKGICKPNKTSFKKGFIPWNKGKKLPVHTDEQKLQISLSLKEAYKIGRMKGMLGKHHTEEARKSMSEKRKGDKCHLWKGGISFAPYSLDWKGSLKELIRKRDNFTCQICGVNKTKKKLAIHHIDYNRMNCDTSNLIALCNSCHTKTNTNREYWNKYLNTLLKEKSYAERLSERTSLKDDAIV